MIYKYFNAVLSINQSILFRKEIITKLNCKGLLSHFRVTWSTVLFKAALLSCARFTFDIHAKFFLLLLNDKEVQKLRSKLSGYMYVTYTRDTNPSTDGKQSAVFTAITKHSLNQELNESSKANLIRRNRIEQI